MELLLRLSHVLVDTCVGNDKPRQNPGWHMLQTDFLDRLVAAGCPPESVDLVLCTHLHVDHVGWNTMLAEGRWVPTFPRARYLFGRVEFEHWSTQTERADMLRTGVAWWPGGRTRHRAFGAVPFRTPSTAPTQAPAAARPTANATTR